MLLLYSYALVGLTVASKSISKVCLWTLSDDETWFVWVFLKEISILQSTYTFQAISRGEETQMAQGELCVRHTHLANCSRCFSILSSTSQKPRKGEPRESERGREMEEENGSHQVRSHCLVDWTICKSVLSASRFCRTPRSAVHEGRCTIGRHLFHPSCPLTSSSWLLTRTHILCISVSHTAVYDDRYLPAEWRVGSVEGHLATWVLPAVYVSLC